MLIKFSKQIKQNALTIMRRLGYKPWRDPRSGQHSFIKRLGASYYPRFHAHPKYDQNNNLMIDLHFDWRKPMHKRGVKSTEGEESDVVQKEVERIRSILGE